jgi:hypothetical protein
MFFRKYRDSRIPFKKGGDVNPEFRLDPDPKRAKFTIFVIKSLDPDPDLDPDLDLDPDPQ